MSQPWKDKLLPASFRQVRFFVQRHSLEGGRRLVVTEYPARDDADVDDLGGKVHRFQLEIFGLGRDYFAWRDQLRAAFDAPGPGDLSHPYLGELQACVESYSISEQDTEGGLFRASATFVESAPGLRVITQVDHAGQSAAAAAKVSAAIHPNLAASVATALKLPSLEALTAAIDSLVPEFPSLAGMLGDAMAAIGELYGAAVGPLRALVNDLRAAGAILEAIVDCVLGLAELDAQAAFAQDPAAPRVDPGRQAEHLASAVAGLGSQWPDPMEGLPAAPGPWSPVAATEAQARLAQVQEALLLSGRAACLSALAAQLAQAEFQVADEALSAAAAVDRLAEAVLADKATGHELREATADLRASAERHLRSVVAQLPRRCKFTPASTVPAIVIAQRLYGDATRAAEIVGLNSIANPLFCAGGQELEVLSDA